MVQFALNRYLFSGKKTLTVQDGTELPLNGISVYILRSSSKRALGEETFQREIMLGNIFSVSTF